MNTMRFLEIADEYNAMLLRILPLYIPALTL